MINFAAKSMIKMKKIRNIMVVTGLALVALTACNPNKNKRIEELLKTGIHTVIVQEIVQTSNYTYMRLQELGNPEIKASDTLWAATTYMEPKNGDTLYYKGGMPMINFKSRELNRTFKKVLFLDSLSKKPPIPTKEALIGTGHNMMGDSAKNGKPQIKKVTVALDKVADAIPIADLFAKKMSFNGKIVKINGQVTKFSKEIMGKNWMHIQDGSEWGGKFDITMTTDLKTKASVGDVVYFEGIVAVDKNIGQGYFYEILVEDAKILKLTPHEPYE
jgi:hypothetical protein